ncbi:hypothetical protein NMF83_15775 [Clostridioides difficile]|uniref:hypothetical protein n=1 Tax=Clostridioides difficile TaxID=1496 RepID=UPI000D1E926C|nr:hypothetical protein [Clostridioides difficile]MCM0736536.1 hypothetical protein [Clostridioides difficile]MCM0740601.1 hypothetical protein [Clostridioides difficile]MCM0744143.1 hypothetical protein [Clostridioides difficile]MCP8363877.1 hypothetical protein [Clostridioides difficile]MCP8367759.1 hypothetical protein [Clostridioides difficile]
MPSIIMEVVGVLFIAIGLILTFIEIKGNFPSFYGFGQNSIGKNAVGIIAAGIALIFFRNGIDSIDSIATYGVFLAIELVVIVAYFLIRKKFTEEDKHLRTN